MPVDRGKHNKQAVLMQHATLNPSAGGVTHALFESSEFFDADDVLQVKYEMLRLVNVDKRPISEAARVCGFSRPSFYQARAAFEHGGLAALIAHKPGPHDGHKLTPAVLQFVVEARTADPGVRAQRLAERVHQRFGVQVHPRSIERQLQRELAQRCYMRVDRRTGWWSTRCTRSGTRSCVCWPRRTRSTHAAGSTTRAC